MRASERKAVDRNRIARRDYGAINVSIESLREIFGEDGVSELPGVARGDPTHSHRVRRDHRLVVLAAIDIDGDGRRQWRQAHTPHPRLDADALDIRYLQYLVIAVGVVGQAHAMPVNGLGIRVTGPIEPLEMSPEIRAIWLTVQLIELIVRRSSASSNAS